MSDNQSENSAEWGLPRARATALDAEREVQRAEQEVSFAEEALREAYAHLRRAEGKLLLQTVHLSWKDILVPKTSAMLENIYTACMQLGYGYALWNGRVFRAGAPGEGMVDTGIVEEDIK